MARRKVKLAFIENDSKRKATFKKRKKGILKKVSELSTLCGIDACAIIYSPFQNHPDVWPEPEGVHRVISQFKSLPEMDQNRKMLDSESFIRQRAAKVSDQLRKQLHENREQDMTMLMNQCLAGSRGVQNLMMPDLNDLGLVIDQNIRDIQRQIEAMKKSTVQEGGSLEAAPENVGLQEETPGMNVDAAEDLERPQWLTEWMGAPNEQAGFGHGNGDDMMLPFNDANNQGNMWPGPFFP